jgi:hypothetical protein
LSEKRSSFVFAGDRGSGPADHDEPARGVGAQCGERDVIDPVKHFLGLREGNRPVIAVAAARRRSDRRRRAITSCRGRAGVAKLAALFLVKVPIAVAKDLPGSRLLLAR